MSRKSTVVGVSVDWVTVTTQDEGKGLNWYELFLAHKKKFDKGKPLVHQWSNPWYSGARCEGLIWAQSEQLGYIMIAQGPPAGDLHRRLIPAASNVSRIDVQVTVELAKPWTRLAKQVYEHSLETKRLKTSWIQNSRSGQTVYIGSRNSDQFGRVYDKGVQAGVGKDPGTFWRYEVELKKPRSMVFAESLMSIEEPGKSEAEEIQSFVHKWFYSRGVKPVFNAKSGRLIAEVGRRVTSKEQKLTWLRTQVRPTFQRLMAEGHGKDAMVAVGIDPYQLGSFDTLQFPPFDRVDPETGEVLLRGPLQ